MIHEAPNYGRSRAIEVLELGQLTVLSEREGDVHTITLVGGLDPAGAKRVEDELERVEATDALSIVIDLSALTFVDSSGVRLLINADARSRADGNRLLLLRGPAAVQRVFEICQVDGLLPFAD